MIRYAPVLTLAVAASIAGYISIKQAQSPTAPPAQAVNFAQQVKPAAPREISPFPLLSGPLSNVVVPNGGLPGVGGLGLTPINPMEDFADVQIEVQGQQDAAAQLAANVQPNGTPVTTQAGTLPADQSQAMPAAQPDTLPTTRIVAQDATAAAAPIYVPAYVPQDASQYAPEYIPQIVLVQTCPLVIVQPEFIPYPVFEPIFIIDRRRAIDCSIIVHEQHPPRPHIGVLPASGGASGTPLAAAIPFVRPVTESGVINRVPRPLLGVRLNPPQVAVIAPPPPPVAQAAPAIRASAPQPTPPKTIVAATPAETPRIAKKPDGSDVPERTLAAPNKIALASKLETESRSDAKTTSSPKVDSPSAPIVETPPAKPPVPSRLALRDQTPVFTPQPPAAPVAIRPAPPVMERESAPVARPSIPVIKAPDPTPAPAPTSSGASNFAGRSPTINRVGRTP